MILSYWLAMITVTNTYEILLCYLVTTALFKQSEINYFENEIGWPQNLIRNQ